MPPTPPADLAPSRPRSRRAPAPAGADPERQRLAEDADRTRHWKRFGPYLSERQWATVREDYSAGGSCWDYFPHDHARSRAYRWGEDGLLGISDHKGRLAFALALWNGRDPILKERLFGLTGPEGNHGEDVKEAYFYLDSTPTHSYMKALYKYPQGEFPYAQLVEENRRRGIAHPEFEIADTGAFDDGRYFDVAAEYAKASPNDVLIRVHVTNHGPEAARLDVLPTLWFRNTWSWGRTGEGYPAKPSITADAHELTAEHEELGRFRLAAAPAPDGTPPPLLVTENETNSARLFGVPNPTAFVKDAFHEYVIAGRRDAVSPEGRGTKAAAHYRLDVPAGATVTLRLRLFAAAEAPAMPFGRDFDAAFAARLAEADAFYDAMLPGNLSPDERQTVRQGYAGLLFSKQFYYYVVKDWLEGDPAQPPPPPERRHGRNHDWPHLYNRDVISMPDKWEYPWYAAWDLAFHMVPFARLDPDFAKSQLELLLREWYLHPNGQIPAYEFAFSDVNPPVHAWAAWRTYKITAPAGQRDRNFLRRVFDKLLMNFTWWVNRKDPEGRHLFSGGFLGLDNIGVFDRSRPLPTGGHLEQADGTAWMGFYCATMLSIAIELAREDPVYEDMASKFFEHFVAIIDAMNTLGGSGLWDEQDGFYYDQLHLGDGDGGERISLKVRSLVGLIPLLAMDILDDAVLEGLPEFRKRLEWFVANRPDLARHIDHVCLTADRRCMRLIAVPSREHLTRVLRYMLDESEFLSPYGIRSVSHVHAAEPYVFRMGDADYRVEYVPGESTSHLFGGNSNWRGPIWFPVNYLLVEALERFHHFYGDDLTVECPTGSGRFLTLREVAGELALRLSRIFLPDESGVRPFHGPDRRWVDDPAWRSLTLFHEYFHGDTGRGLGASHQTGWTALAVRLVEDIARHRARADAAPARARAVT
jgi:Mannosylglycerate hydrolase MGH1-like glycoside hydrolase domain